MNEIDKIDELTLTKRWATYVEAYDFQSNHGLDFDGWRIRRDGEKRDYYLTCLENGEWRRMSEAEYLNLVEGVSS